MADYPWRIKIAWAVTDQTLREWQAFPNNWRNERELQAELFSRLRTAFASLGEHNVRGEYKGNQFAYDRSDEWPRVAIEPYVHNAVSGSHCFPDLVINGECNDPSEPPDRDKKNWGKWPLLWACELKMRWDGKDESDEQKLRELIESELLQYGCVLKCICEPSPSQPPEWKQLQTTISGPRLWEIRAWIPEGSVAVVRESV
jgi:hypothetical protein